MQLQTVVLRHVRRQDTHYDWLIDPPPTAGGLGASGLAGAPGAPGAQGGPGLAGGRLLWAARAPASSDRWAELGGFVLTALPPHRRRYLAYQGPVSDGRGAVVRVDAGWVRPLLWRTGRLLLEVRLGGFDGLADLRRISATGWRATVEKSCNPGV